MLFWRSTSLPYFRAKLGYGLLSGEYSKPAPDPGEGSEPSSEPRVSEWKALEDCAEVVLSQNASNRSTGASNTRFFQLCLH